MFIIFRNNNYEYVVYYDYLLYTTFFQNHLRNRYWHNCVSLRLEYTIDPHCFRKDGINFLYFHDIFRESVPKYNNDNNPSLADYNILFLNQVYDYAGEIDYICL